MGDGNQRQIYSLVKSKGYTLHRLPTDYTTIKPFVLKTNDIYVAKRSISHQEVQNEKVSKPFVNFKQ